MRDSLAAMFFSQTKTRRPWALLFEIALPLGLFAILALLRTLITRRDFPGTSYDPSCLSNYNNECPSPSFDSYSPYGFLGDNILYAPNTSDAAVRERPPHHAHVISLRQTHT
jgi:hypothetical protein